MEVSVFCFIQYYISQINYNIYRQSETCLEHCISWDLIWSLLWNKFNRFLFLLEKSVKLYYTQTKMLHRVVTFKNVTASCNFYSEYYFITAAGLHEFKMLQHNATFKRSSPLWSHFDSLSLFFGENTQFYWQYSKQHVYISQYPVG